MEAKLRAKLEEEVRDLREEGGGPGHAHHHHQQDTEGLLRKLSQAEEKVPRPRECVFAIKRHGLEILFSYLLHTGRRPLIQDRKLSQAEEKVPYQLRPRECVFVVNWHNCMQWCESGVFIPGPNFFHPGSWVKKFPGFGSASASKNLSIFTQKIVHPGSGS
jgi:hypothetical protein